MMFMMRKYAGQGVFGGVCVGTAVVWRTRLRKIDAPRVRQSDDEEEQRFFMAQRTVRDELLACHREMRANIAEDDAAVFDIQAMMVEDEEWTALALRGIREDHWTADAAIAAAAEQLIAKFDEMQDPYLRERAADVRQISERMIAVCRAADGEASDGDCDFSLPGTPCIVCADDLSPAQTVRLDRTLVRGFVTARGSATSHTAVLARSLGLPALVGVGDETIAALRDGDQLALDADKGTLYVQPDDSTLAHLEQRERAEAARRAAREQYRGKKTVSASGQKIRLYANAALPGDVADVLASDAEGIGLFRSEFLYLDRKTPPDEEEQYRIYRDILENMQGRRVIVRTLDIGADKQAAALSLSPREENPALGCRAVRHSLLHPTLFLTQARALLRAAQHGNLSVMFPLITDEQELREILALWEVARSELKDAAAVELGIMIETPAAALISDRLAPLVDFFSIGTNDLTQYTLAMDRQNEALRPFYRPHHPAILALIRMTVEHAKAAGIWVGICGELGADRELTETFLRMGVDELSVAPSQILALREQIAKLP